MVDQYLSQTQQQRMQIALAPQLRQSLELLQVPILELRTLVQQEIEQNPTMEEIPNEQEQVEVEPNSKEEGEQDNAELDFKEEYEVLARLDDEWREYFQQTQSAQPYTRDDEARRQFFLESLSREVSLQEHLLNQLSLSELSPGAHQLGEMIIGSINDDGYLTVGMEELAHSTGHETIELEDILAVIQDFDPIGVGARDLQECLLLQLHRLGKTESLEADVVRQYLPELGSRKYQEIARLMKLAPEEVQRLAQLIATLEPRPGRRFTAEAATYVLPEVVVQEVNGEYVILLNDDQIPHLRISRHYRELLDQKGTGRDVKSYIREKIRAGAFLIKSINQRQQTIRNIATQIVDIQREFLEHGVSHLRPLTMSEIADKIGIHETTVSRAIANKYMQTPRGMYEMKYFFTPGYQTADGTVISNKTIKDVIARMVEQEDCAKPLSDQAIAERLKEEGTKVARRTVAKYREELNILPSYLRKSI